jgi:hypothetical protein
MSRMTKNLRQCPLVRGSWAALPEAAARTSSMSSDEALSRADTKSVPWMGQSGSSAIQGPPIV